MNRLLLSSSLLAFGCILFLSGCIEETPAKALGPFNQIYANGFVTFKFVTGADNKVISTNLSEAMYSVGSGQLNVNGGGSMTIAIRDIKSLWCNGCSVENPEALIADTLIMSIHAGSVDLKDIQINGYLALNAQNTGTYEFSGFAHFFNVSSINLVSIEAFDMVTDSTYVSSTSIINTEVNATKCVNVFILSSGNVLYKGDPPIVRLTRTGSGQLIKK